MKCGSEKVCALLQRPRLKQLIQADAVVPEDGAGGIAVAGDRLADADFRLQLLDLGREQAVLGKVNARRVEWTGW